MDRINLEGYEWDYSKFLLFYSVKDKRSQKIELDKKFKGKERTKTLSYQKAVDKYKKNFKKKARSVKEKGKTCKGGIACNSRCAKSWRHFGGIYGMPPYKNSDKFTAIWMMT